MRRNAVGFVLSSFVLTLATACSSCEDKPVEETKVVNLEIVSISPEVVFIEGADTVTLKTRNGCGAAAELVVADLATKVTAVDADTLTFNPPPKDVGARSTFAVKLSCSAPADPKTKYGNGKAETSIIYDPQIAPHAIIKTYLPNGTDASVISEVVVTFTRAIDPTTVTNASFGINGVQGTIRVDADAKTIRFKPGKQLDYSTAYTAFVTTEIRKFKPTLPDAKSDRDEWTFTTRCEGCGNPWIGDIAAAAGISSGGQYKLFSVTGQPTPVGEASNEQYKVQSGFIFATTPVVQP